jgi:D-arabinose 1-dehydrogenase-like Zn-dependent alcohol dehydrogenase
LRRSLQVPGHELVGTVTQVGASVTAFKAGDKVGVGCLVGSCHSCKQCAKGKQQYCGGLVFTYNSKLPDGRITFGGYSDNMVCDQRFVLRMPSNLPLDAAAPLLCAGITVYSPMRGQGLDKPGLRLGVLGLGGLGSMAVRFGASFGCEVTVISTSPGKEAEARALGAKHFLLSSDKAAMAAAAGSLDGVVDTVSAKHDLGTYLNLLDVDGKLVLVGVAPEPMDLHAFSIIGGGKAVIGSLIGGLPETQEMLDYCGKHNIVSTIEKIPIDYINTAYSRLMKNDVKGRFVIDMATLRK